jgi:hypothetical protein
MRARAAENRRLPLSTNLRLALILGVTVFLAWHPGMLMPAQPFWPGAAHEAIALLVVATVVAVWFAPRGVTFVLALLASGALGLTGRHVYDHDLVGMAMLVVPPLLLAALVATEAVRPPRCWPWLPTAIGAATVLFYLQYVVADQSPRLSSMAGSAGTVVYVGLLAAVFLWLVTDARPLLALVIAFGLAIEPDVLFGALRFGVSTAQSIWVLAPVALAAFAVLRMRRKDVVAAPR